MILIYSFCAAPFFIFIFFLMSALDGLSLGQLFSTGQTLLSELEDTSLSSVDPEYQAKVADAIQRLRRADALVAQLNIFSDNEIIDDINTNDLKFLLITAYLGDLTLKVSGKDIDRSKILEKSKVTFFLKKKP